MTSPESDYDQLRLRTLATAFMNGMATETQQRELTKILREDAAARDEYLTLIDLHAVLATEPAAAPSKHAGEPLHGAKHPRRVALASRRKWFYVAGGVALAACLLIAVMQIAEPEREVGAAAPFSTVVQTTEAEWAADAVSAGDRFGRGTIRLKSGFVRLEFDSGVEVTLQGPAEFELLAPANTILKSGLLTATVPVGAEGFTVDTPTAEVVDLGTSFGIDLREDGFSRVSVFDGEVAVASLDASKKRRLAEGESVRIGADQQIEEIAFDPKRFEKVWPISSGIVGSTETFRFIPPWPKRIRFIQSNEDIFVAAEGRAVHLTREVRVNISEPGEYTRVAELTPQELLAGVRVRSYILHFSPTENLGPRRATRVSGSITFARPVLGLIVQHEELLGSMRRFSRRAAGEAQQRRELNLTGGGGGDRISLSADRRTVSLDVVSPGRSTDLVRIIVDGARKRPTAASKHE